MALLNDGYGGSREDLKPAPASPGGRPFDQTEGPQLDRLYELEYSNLGTQAHGPPSLRQLMNGVVNSPTNNDSDALAETLLRAQAQGKAYSAALAPDDLAAIAVQEDFTRRPEAAASDWDKNAHFRACLNIPIPRAKRAPPSDATWGPADARA